MQEHERGGAENSDLEDSFLRQFALGDEDERPLRPIPGEWLGGRDGRRFRILEDLGRGGMGLVLRAWDEVLHRTVALKFLVPQARRSRASQLKREARAVARLDHENIVRVLDLSEWCVAPPDERVPFLVMEYLEGESLSALLRRGRLELPRALAILGTVAAGLAHAHARQVIHRDLKPGNVFLTRDGRVKLLDFGLARLAALGTTTALPLPVTGTPAYMAPEQWRGLAQDARTDIWAAGLLLFEMLAGALPFQLGSYEALRAQVLSSAPIPSLRERRPELPEAVERILARALAREPERRFPSAEALREQVDALVARLGSQRHAASDSPQHRQVTLVACRLAGVDDRLGPGDVNEVVAAFQKGCQQLLHRHGCGLTMGMGDEVVACFGHPVAHEDDSQQAVRAGQSLAAGLAEELRRQLPHLPEQALAVRVGIHTDRVVMGGPGQEAGAMTTISGEAPKVAAWLASEAAPGTVLLSQPTQALVQGGFDVQALGCRLFAGLGRTASLQVYQLGRERKADSRFERSRGGGALLPLVGRESELEVLREHWRQARRGQGGLVLVRGEAGIGKSRLIQELKTRAAAESACCWHVQCWRQSSNSALLPVIELLLRVLGLTGSEDAAVQRERLEARLAPLELPPGDLELLAHLLSMPVAEHSPLPRLTAEERKEKTREALTGLLLRMVRARPVLIVLEDLQWADPSTLELLGYLLDHLSTASLLVLSSARTGFAPPWPERPHFRVLTLERLSAAHTEALLREVAPGGQLPADMARQLAAKAGGVPLFIEELTRMVLERKPRAGDALAPSIPVTLYELLLARLDQLTPRQKALAQLCAVVGRGVGLCVLARLSEEQKDTLEEVLSELIALGVLQREPSGSPEGPGYRFRHALFQDAAYQSLLRSTRRRHHARIARLLEQGCPHLADAQPEWLAHHYTEAGEAERAIPYWLRAGESANERSAFVESLGHLRQGLALLESLPDGAGRIREEIALRLALGASLVELQGFESSEQSGNQARLHALLRQVDAAWLPTDVAYWTPFLCIFSLGSIPAARELASRLMEAGARLGHDELLGHGHRMRSTVLFLQGDFPAARAALDEALAFHAEPGRQPFPARAQRKRGVIPLAAVHCCAACLHSLSCQPALSREHAWAALRLAERSGHPYTLAYVRTFLAIAHQFRREGREALDQADRASELAREHGLLDWLGWARTVRAWALAELGQLEDGLQQMRACLGSDVWASQGSRPFLPVLGAAHAGLLLKLGLLEDGQAAARWGLEWVERTEERLFEAELYRVQGELLHRAGREDEAAPWLHRALDVARRQRARTLELRAAVSLGRQLEARGRPDEALAVLRRSSECVDPRLDVPDVQDARALLLQLSPPN